MKIIRERRTENFTVLANEAIRDRRLSFRARGLLSFLLSQPDGYRTNGEVLAEEASEGRDAIRTALRELEALGYLERRKAQDPSNGRWSTFLALIDSPSPSAESALDPTTDFQASGPDDGFPVVGCPTVGSPTVGFSGAKREELQEELPPPPTPSSVESGAAPTTAEEEVTPSIDFREFAAELRVIVRENGGKAPAVWTAKAVRLAFDAALEAGYEPTAIAPALRALAADAKTHAPARLTGAGEWWAVEERRLAAERAATVRDLQSRIREAERRDDELGQRRREKALVLLNDLDPDVASRLEDEALVAAQEQTTAAGWRRLSEATRRLLVLAKMVELAIADGVIPPLVELEAAQ